MMNNILITGATGHLGSAVVQTLLKTMHPHAISILTRDADKQKSFQDKGFNAYVGSYDDAASLELAMKGVETVLLISSGDQGNRMQEHKNVVDAAKKMGVKNLAYTGRCLRDRKKLVNTLMEEHFQTEDYIMASGLKYIFFRNILYMDAIPQFVGGMSALELGIHLPAGNGHVSFALRSELGEAMAQVLLNESFDNTIYNLTGDRSYSFYDVAAALTELSGNEVRYTDIEISVFFERMKQRNLPDPVIHKIAGFITDIKNNQEAGVSGTMEKYLGRKPATLKDGLKLLFEL